MFNWLRELYDIRLEYAARIRECPGCDILRQQLAILNRQNQDLLSKVIDRPVETQVSQPIEITPPKNVPWRIRRQMLETEDREKARILRDAPTPKVSTEDLEREMDLVENTRINHD